VQPYCSFLFFEQLNYLDRDIKLETLPHNGTIVRSGNSKTVAGHVSILTSIQV